EPKPTNRYLWGTKQDELICNNNNWTLNDHLNTIRDIVKSDGNVESHLEYNAFGKLISETKNDLPLFAYTGKLTDKSSDLQWNINRWYDSNAGRWMSEDPIGLNADDNNLSRYVNNNTMTNYDLFGLAVHNFFLAGTIRSTTYTKEIKVGNHPVTISVSLEKNVVIHNGTHGQLDHEIGYTSQSFYSACNLSACVPKYWWNKRAGFKFSPRINIVVIVVKLIRPLPSNGNNKEIWLHHLADHNSNKAGTDIVSLAQFESKIINHENHHYQPFVKAVELMKDVVNSHEETKFDTKEEADKDCADNVIPKLGKIWQAALLHSAKYDTEPTWKANSYTSTIYNPFTYP
ncbi:MAG: RHS repeat-associated core domain-containing protein, partial [Planctomycetaceae bacterium]|nr:RHS repeat-associated core domain-containing protein [Planctomycetaceae bacterium]